MRLFLLGVIAVSIACSSDQPATPDGGPADAGKDAFVGDTSKPIPTCATGAKCDGMTGLCVAIPACPCTPDDAGVTVTAPIPPVTCKTTDPSRKQFDDGPPRMWKDDTTGEQRMACVYTPPGASSTSKVPLVVFLHSELDSASAVYDETSLRDKAQSFDMIGTSAGDGGTEGGASDASTDAGTDGGSTDGGSTGSAAGFILASDQGRNLQWPNGPAGSYHDIYYRQGDNPDSRNLDRLIDELVAIGNVDTHRIFIMGWGNGGLFAQAYAISRGVSATQGGNYVTAAAVYSAADPYQGLTDLDPLPLCVASTQPTQTPIMVVGRNCDLIACDQGQVYEMRQYPGANMDAWFKHLSGVLGDPGAQRIILDAQGNVVTQCNDPQCTQSLGATNHGNWPDGVADKGGIDTEKVMLEFLRSKAM